MMQDNLNQQENQMSKPNTDQPTPLVVAGEATEVPETAPVEKKGRVRKALKKVGTTLKENKTTAIAVGGLVILMGGSAYLGRQTAPSNDPQPETEDVNYDAEIAELDAAEAETPVA
jgi:hypothetical protein